MNKGICPVCNGTTRVPVPEQHHSYKTVMASYDPATDTLRCQNCGGQYQFGGQSIPSGYVALREDGTPCVHKYNSVTIGNCLHRSTCMHCGDSHDIDSGD